MSQQVCTDCTPTAPSSAPSASAPASAAASPAAAALAATADITAPVTTYPHVLIEYCDRCRWAPRASWTQTELLLTFPPPLIRTISLQPLNTPETGGRFRVWVDVAGKGWELAWDRKTEGGFPELKLLKQRVRNFVQPEMDLGHSDVKKH